MRNLSKNNAEIDWVYCPKCEEKVWYNVLPSGTIHFRCKNCRHNWKADVINGDSDFNNYYPVEDLLVGQLYGTKEPPYCKNKEGA